MSKFGDVLVRVQSSLQRRLGQFSSSFQAIIAHPRNRDIQSTTHSTAEHPRTEGYIEGHVEELVEEKARRHAARAEALVRTSARLNAQLDHDTIIKLICEETRNALGSDLLTFVFKLDLACD